MTRFAIPMLTVVFSCAAAQQVGEALYRSFCTSCHGADLRAERYVQGGLLDVTLDPGYTSMLQPS